jgi:hypothetical protein
MIKVPPTKSELPSIPQQPSTPKGISSRQRVAESLFCAPGFAMVDFKQMDEEDWRLHAQRAWEIAGFFVSEIKQLKSSR